MRGVDSDRLMRLVDELAPLFYALMGVSLLAFLVGSLGSGAALLILGAGVQVVRAGCEEFAARRRARAVRSRPVAARRSARHRPAAQPRRAPRPVVATASRR